MKGAPTVGIVVIIIVLGFVFLSEEEIKYPLPDIETLNESVLAEEPYTELLYQNVTPSGKKAVTFAVKNRGNRVSFGDIVVTDLGTSSNEIVRTFSTSPHMFSDTVSLTDEKLEYVEVSIFGGGDLYISEMTYYINDLSKNVSINLDESIYDGYLARHDPGDSRVSEQWTRGSLKWISDNKVEFTLDLSDSIGSEFPSETWQYSFDTKEYTYILDNE